MAHPKLTSRPLASTISRLPSGKTTSSTCGLTSSHGELRSASIWISLSKWPMLPTMARFFICRMWSIDHIDVAGRGDKDVAL